LPDGGAASRVKMNAKNGALDPAPPSILSLALDKANALRDVKPPNTLTPTQSRRSACHISSLDLLY